MAKSKQCNYCDQPATIHLTQIVNNEMQKVDLCEACASQQGLTDPEGFSLNQILQQESTQADATSPVCEVSGVSLADFKKTGRLGSAACYDLFYEHIKPILKNLHKSTKHTGKVPAQAKSAKASHEKEHLQKELAIAIKEERYEDAAELRDTLNRIDSKQTCEK